MTKGKKQYSQAELGLESSLFYEAQFHSLEQIACRSQSENDIRLLASTKLDMGRTKEKLGNFVDATILAQESHALYCDVGDESGVSQCCHTLAVWAFHQGDDTISVQSFKTAAEIRERIGEFFLGAQSWHNLGYVQCRIGRHSDAFHSYSESRRLLDRVREDQSKDLIAKANRNLGFVLSHLAFATAKFRDQDDAIAATIEYFEHVSQTKSPKEPLLAYLAPAIALASNKKQHLSAYALHLQNLTGLQMKPDVWFQFSLDYGVRAFLSHEAGSRRPYLGARMLTLAEYGWWCLRNNRAHQGQVLLANAASLALARGWKGEARRFSCYED